MVSFRLAVRAAALVGTALCFPSIASSQSSTAALPTRTYLDSNGVNLFTGTVMLRSPVLQAGASQHLRYYQVRAGGIGYKDNLQGAVTVSGTVATVTIGETTEQFSVNGGVYTPFERRGSTLSGGGALYTYKTADGTTYSFQRDPTCNNCRTVYTQWGDVPVIKTIVYADGGRLDFTWESKQTQVGQTPAGPVLADVRRVTAISSNDGYSLNFKFLKEPSSNDFVGSTVVAKVTAFNSGQDGCSGGTNCTATGRPSLSINGTSYTDSLNRTTVVSTNAIRRPGSQTDNVVYTYDSSSRVTQVVADGVTTAYGYTADVGDIRTVTIAQAGGQPRTVTFNIAQRTMRSDTDPTGRKTSYDYDSSNRVIVLTAPELNYTRFNYDERGNTTSTVFNGKSGGTLSTSATYPCTIAAACNSPSSSTDANGNVTNYDYDLSSGLPTKVTAPAPVPGGARPEKRMSYTQLGGAWRLTSTSECRTAGPSGCTNGADEVKTTIAYAGSAAPVSSISVGAGDNSLTATTSMTYDAMGRLLTADGPLTGSDDTTRSYYDVEGQLLGSVGPDPDGPGALQRRAIRNTYSAAGQLTLVESGTAVDQSDASLANMTVLQSVATTYDSNNRKVAVSTTAGGTTFAYSQINYDGRGRINCTVTRMNPAAFTSTADACTVGPAGSFGADRITQTTYDDANRVLTVTTALGTPEASTQRMSYTNNGQLRTQTDANSNVTTFEYDGFDRLSIKRLPNASGGGSSGSDYEQYTYDANGNVVTRRVRDGATLYYTYDALNRRTNDDNPGVNVAEVDASYTYDNQGRLLRAGDQNGWFAAYEYDALGRTTRQYSNVSSNVLTYDLGGRLTRQAWADGYFASYEYLVTGEASVVRENGGLALASFTYDNLGRRVSLARANGTVTSYGYDAASRLTSMTQDLAGNSQDVSFNFAFNPINQIASRTTSNDAYTFNGSYNVDRSYAANGLNQYTQSGTVALGYDGRGNLTNAGNGAVYTYNSRNQLFTNNSSQLFYRNPMGLLNHIIANGTTTNLDYVGANLASEFDGNSGTLLRRYVYGPGDDEPLVWYEGSDRRYLHADERGSIIAVTNNAGTATAINTYDEYGIPGTGNQGRFQYTGQKWVSELGLYDYKARMYSPTLGRFMQTDPVGYADGMNWYNYVGGDPVNSRDSSGTNLGPNPSAAEIARYAEAMRIMSVNAMSRGSEVANMTMAMQDSAQASAMLFAAAPYIKEIADFHEQERAQKAAVFVEASILSVSIQDVKERTANYWDRIKRIGALGESQVLDSLAANGIRVIGQQVYVRTNENYLRIWDFVALAKNGGATAIEVKTNGGYYSSFQRSNDMSILNYGGRIVGGGVLVSPLRVGATVKIPTVLVQVYVTPPMVP